MQFGNLPPTAASSSRNRPRVRTIFR